MRNRSCQFVSPVVSFVNSNYTVDLTMTESTLDVYHVELWPVYVLGAPVLNVPVVPFLQCVRGTNGIGGGG